MPDKLCCKERNGPLNGFKPLNVITFLYKKNGIARKLCKFVHSTLTLNIKYDNLKSNINGKMHHKMQFVM